jgi:putative Holliday junction resolvase
MCEKQSNRNHRMNTSPTLIVSIDFGIKRVGLAVSDFQQKIALPLTTVPGGKLVLLNIEKALGHRLAQIERFIVGYPLLLSGKRGSMASLVETFASQLEQHFHLPVELVDERLSSQGAERLMKTVGLSRKQRAQHTDATAASLLLQTYLDKRLSKRLA